MCVQEVNKIFLFLNFRCRDEKLRKGKKLGDRDIDYSDAYTHRLKKHNGSS